MVSYGHAPSRMMPPHDCTLSHSLVRKWYQYDALDWTPPLRPTRDTRINRVWCAGDDRIPDLRVTSVTANGTNSVDSANTAWPVPRDSRHSIHG